MFLETLIVLLVLIFAGSLLLGLLQLMLGLVLLPLKLALLLTKGLLALVIGLPLLLVGGLILGLAVPAVLLLVIVPVWLFGGLACLLAA
jgi:hypothetical protein